MRHENAPARAAGGGQRGRCPADPARTAQRRFPDRVGAGGDPDRHGTDPGGAALGSHHLRSPHAVLQFRGSPGRPAPGWAGSAFHHRLRRRSGRRGHRRHAPGRPRLHLQGQSGAPGAGGAAGAEGSRAAPGPRPDGIPAGGERAAHGDSRRGGGAGGRGHRHHRRAGFRLLRQPLVRKPHRLLPGPDPGLRSARTAGPPGGGSGHRPGLRRQQLGGPAVPAPGRPGPAGSGRDPVPGPGRQRYHPEPGGRGPGHDQGNGAGKAAPAGPEDGCARGARRRHRP